MLSCWPLWASDRRSFPRCRCSPRRLWTDPRSPPSVSSDPKTRAKWRFSYMYMSLESLDLEGKHQKMIWECPAYVSRPLETPPRVTLQKMRTNKYVSLKKMIGKYVWRSLATKHSTTNLAKFDRGFVKGYDDCFNVVSLVTVCYTWHIMIPWAMLLC